MRDMTAGLWSDQDRRGRDRPRLFRSVDAAAGSLMVGGHEVDRVLYPGSFVDVAPSFVWRSVTYVDTDRRAAAFFADEAGVREIIAAGTTRRAEHEVAFTAADYTADLPFEHEAFDLLISLYAGPISLHCTDHLRTGGLLLVNPSHGDAALASLDDRYVLVGVVRSGSYAVSTDDLDTYLDPKRPVELTVDAVLHSGRGIAYTRSPFAYLFRRER